MKKNTVRILEVLMIAMMIMVFIPMTAKAAEQEDSEIITAAELAKLLPAKDFEINVTKDDRGWNVISVNIPFKGVSIERYINGILTLKDTESDESDYEVGVDLVKNGNALTGTAKVNCTGKDAPATYKVNKLEIIGQKEVTYVEQFVYSICYFEDPVGPGQSDDVFICYLPEEEVASIELEFSGPLTIGEGEDNKLIIPIEQPVRLKFEPSVTGDYYLNQDIEQGDVTDRSWMNEDGTPHESHEFEEGKTYYKDVYYERRSNGEGNEPETFGIWMQLDKGDPTVSSVTLPETMSAQQICQGEVTVDSPNGVKYVSLTFSTTEEAGSDYETHVSASSSGKVTYEGNKITFSVYLEHFEGNDLYPDIKEGDTLFLRNIAIQDKIGKSSYFNVEDYPSLRGATTTYVSVKSVIEAGGNSHFHSLNILSQDVNWTIPANGNVETEYLSFIEEDNMPLNGKGSLTLNGTGILKVNKSLYICYGSKLYGSNKILVASNDNQVPDESYLEHLVGADTNAAVVVERSNDTNESEIYKWDGSKWKLKVDEASQSVIDLIDKLPKEIKISDEAAIKAAREEYDGLSEEKKKRFDADALAKLEAAENQLEKIKTDKVAADKVTEEINKLPAKATVSDESAIKAARATFDKLSEDQKKLVDSKAYDKLKDLETQLELLTKNDPGTDHGDNPDNNPVTALSALDSTIVLKKGATKTVTVFVTEADATKVSTEKVELTSSKKKIATASAGNLKKGKLTFKVKGLKAGKSNITAKVGTQTVTVKVTVLKKANKAKSVKAANKKIKMKLNKTRVITVKVTANNKKLATTDVVKATSSKSQNATVSKISTVKGKVKVTVKGLKKGESILTVKVGKKKTNIKVKVQ